MELLVISSPGSFRGEPPLINALFDGGLGVFHLRKPEMSRKDYTAVLDGISAEYRDRVSLHQHHDLSEDFGTGRLHFSEQSRKMQDLGSLSELGRTNILSTSVHDLNDLFHLQDFDYVFMGPVFDSYSKLGCRGIYRSGFKVKPIQEGVRSLSNLKVIALGGIGLDTIGRINEMGFDGAAMLGWIWNDPLKAIDNFKQVQCWISENT